MTACFLITNPRILLVPQPGHPGPFLVPIGGTNRMIRLGGNRGRRLSTVFWSCSRQPPNIGLVEPGLIGAASGLRWTGGRQGESG